MSTTFGTLGLLVNESRRSLSAADMRTPGQPRMGFMQWLRHLGARDTTFANREIPALLEISPTSDETPLPRAA